MVKKLIMAAALFFLPSIAEAGGLRGSASSMKEQHAVAVERDLRFMDDAGQVRSSLASGVLDSVKSNGDFTLSRVSYPYAVPEVKLFIERLGRQYFDVHGTPLVVTSLTRPAGNQPRNAHQLSVHPAGMAVDFRVPQDAKARAWLESALLQLEDRGVLDVTRERNPPHYHVAVFPAAYRAWVEKLPPLAPRPAVAAAPLAILATVAPPGAVAIASSASTTSGPDSSGVLLILAGMGGIMFTTLLVRRSQPDPVELQ
jgi:hypothetical protein